MQNGVWTFARAMPRWASNLFCRQLSFVVAGSAWNGPGGFFFEDAVVAFARVSQGTTA